MTHVYEITHSDGDEIQTVSHLSDETVARLRALGYWVNVLAIDDELEPWLVQVLDRHFNV